MHTACKLAGVQFHEIASDDPALPAIVNKTKRRSTATTT